MDSLAGYVATICVTVIATYLSQFLKPKVKIVYRLSHTFLYTIPTNQLNAQNQPQQALPGGTAIAPQQQAAPNFMLLTHSLTIQNVGRKTAEWVQIVHRRRPDFFQLHPALNYTEGTTPAGEHMLTVQLVAPNDYFTVELLSYLNSPEVLYIRSSAG